MTDDADSKVLNVIDKADGKGAGRDRSLAEREGPLLQAVDFGVKLNSGGREVSVVRGVNLSLDPGERLGVVGETGSGKTVLTRSLIQINRGGLFTFSGSLRFGDIDLLAVSEKQLRSLWGSDIGLVTQNPMTALNPVVPVIKQVEEALCGRRDRRSRAAAEALLGQVSLDGVVGKRTYSWELSGGMSQRVAIAMTLARNPSLLVADEPTTALDVTVQDRVLSLLVRETLRRSMALILVSHDLGVVSQVCHVVAVMYAGTVVESGPTHEVINSPKMRYTEALVAASPALAVQGSRVDGKPGEELRKRLALRTIEGSLPSLGSVPEGCPFAPRCSFADFRCHKEVPPVTRLATSSRRGRPIHQFACWHPAGEKERTA